MASEFLQSCFPQKIENVNRNLKQNCLNRWILLTVPLAIQRRAIRQWLQNVLPTDPNFEQIEKLIQLIGAPNRSQTDPFPGGAIARVEGDWIILHESRTKN